MTFGGWGSLLYINLKKNMKYEEYLLKNICQMYGLELSTTFTFIELTNDGIMDENNSLAY